MIRKVNLIENAFDIVYEVAFYVLITLFLQVVFIQQSVDLLPCVVTLAICILSVWSCNRANNFFELVAFHILVGILCMFIPLRLGDKVIVCFFLSIRTMKSYIYVAGGYKKKREVSAPWPQGALAMLSYMYGFFLHNNALVWGSIGVLFVVVTVYFVKLYIKGLKGYIDATKDVSGLPLSRIISTNTVMVVGIIGSFALLVVIAILLGADGFVYDIVKLLKGILLAIAGVFVAIYKLLSRLGGKTPEDSEIPVVDEGINYVSPDAHVNEYVELFFKMIILAIVMYIGYRLLKHIIVKLMRRLQSPDDVIEKLSAKENVWNYQKSDKKQKGYGSGLEGKIRKNYAKKVLQYRYDIRLRNNLTCEEIEDGINEGLSDEKSQCISEMTELYKQVRYSDIDVDKSMVKRMNELVK